jgi:serine/threonine protein kinase
MAVLFQSDRTVVSRSVTPTGTVIRKEMRGPNGPTRRRHELAILDRLAGVDGVPHLVPDADDDAAIIVEDVGRATLAERLRSGPMGVDVQLALAEDLAAIVAAVHRCGVIHKDINPRNIVLADSPPRAELIDFDLATTFAMERPGFRFSRLLDQGGGHRALRRQKSRPKPGRDRPAVSG